MAYNRGQIRDIVRDRCGLDNTTAQTDAEIDIHINDAAKAVHDFLIATLGDQYDPRVLTLSTVAGTASYNLTAGGDDVYRIIRVGVRIDDLDYPIERFQPSGELLSVNGRSWGPGVLPRYYVYYNLTSADRVDITFDPPPDAVNTVSVHFHNKPPAYSADADPVTLPETDLLIIEAAIRLKFADDRDASHFIAERAAIHNRIESWASPVDQANPARTLKVPQRFNRQPYGYGRRWF